MSICVCIVTRNDRDGVIKTFNSLKFIYNSFIVCHDKACEEEWFTENMNSNSQIIAIEWESIGVNIMTALELCRFRSDYILLLNAGDTLQGNVNFGNLNKEFYYMRYGDKIRSWRPILLKNRGDLEWVFNSMELQFSNEEFGYIQGDYYIEEGVINYEDELDEKLPYDLFLKAENFYKKGELDIASDAYLKIVKVAEEVNNKEIIYYSYFQMANIMQKGGKNWTDVEETYNQSLKIMPRFESLFKILEYYRIENNFLGAEKYVNMAFNLINHPFDVHLCFHTEIYNYKLWDNMSIILYYLGRFKESYVLSQKILVDDEYNLDQKKRLLDNFQFSKNQIESKKKETVAIFTSQCELDGLVEMIQMWSGIYNFVIMTDNCSEIDYDNVVYVKLSDNIEYDIMIFYNTLPIKISLNTAKRYFYWCDSAEFYITIGNRRYEYYEETYIKAFLERLNGIITQEKIEGIESYIIKEWNEFYIFLAQNVSNKYYVNKTRYIQVPKNSQNKKELFNFSLNLPSNRLSYKGMIEQLKLQDRLVDFLNIKKEVLLEPKTTKNNITFTITTCKRLNLFKGTMDNFLLRCKDIHLIDKWICIDDNSSEEDRDVMKRLYPFFTFIFKKEEEKGHVQSMNMLWDMIDTDYVIHFEDDWMCHEEFILEPILDELKANEKCVQIALKGIGHLGIRHKPLKYIEDHTLYEYVYNPLHSGKPPENKIYDKAVFRDLKSPFNHNEYWWWPGFTLNPSIFKFKLLRDRVGYFKEKLPTELFEYDYGQRIHMRDMKVLFVDYPIRHIGDKVSSYKLNDTHRYYDKK